MVVGLSHFCSVATWEVNVTQGGRGTGERTELGLTGGDLTGGDLTGTGGGLGRGPGGWRGGGQGGWGE